jgi:hypothetical protein
MIRFNREIKIFGHKLINITNGKRYSIRYFELVETSGSFRPRKKNILVNENIPINARALLLDNRRAKEITAISKYKELPE